MKVSIVIPNWNGAEKLAKHLPRVIAAKSAEIIEIIVVDDASTDDSLKVLTTFPQVRIIKKSINSGFAGAVNLGVRKSSKESDLVYLLNNDASPSADFLSSLLPHFEDDQVFSVGSNTGGSWAYGKFSKGFFWHQSAAEKPDTAHLTLWASGGSALFRKKIWEELDGLDELFNPFYEEDVDLGYRATKRGYINLWEPKSLVEHYHQGVSSANKEKGVIALNFSSTQVAKVAQRNQLIFIWKNIHSPRMIISHSFFLKLRLLTHPKYILIYFSALKHLLEIGKKRKIEQKNSKLSDSQVLQLFSELN